MSPTAATVVEFQTGTLSASQGPGLGPWPSQRTQCISTPGSPPPTETPPDSEWNV